ncbi:MAG: energy transducer TonB [Bacteroidales bacterium]|nr:energy transducer TonB [Bacteroidales bacterium]HPD96183.1 energy transducer TonB [Tenuifilaceae bacterium]HRX30287.1 energy transducer TonB [Tenuifilaceae bacterium]
METKKSEKANLELKKSIFFEIGLAMSMLFALLAFEWETPINLNIEELTTNTFGGDIVEIPITKPDEISQPQPCPKVIYNDKIVIVDNTITIKTDPNIFTPDYKENYRVTLINPPEEDDVVDDLPFTSVEEMPKFQNGGIEEFNKWVQKNVKYPEKALQNFIQGRVYVSFVVEPNGSVSHVSILKGADPVLDEEVMRVVKLSPVWMPGKQWNKPVRVSFSMPVTFSLQ